MTELFTEKEKKILSLGLHLYEKHIKKIKDEAETAGLDVAFKASVAAEKEVKDLKDKLL